MKNKKEMDMVIDLQDGYILPLDITKKQVKYLIGRVNELKEENEKVIFKAKLTKGVNLSKVIEQVLYPKYIDKEIIIRVVEGDNLRKLKEKDYWAIQKFPGKYRKVVKDE